VVYERSESFSGRDGVIFGRAKIGERLAWWAAHKNERVARIGSKVLTYALRIEFLYLGKNERDGSTTGVTIIFNIAERSSLITVNSTSYDCAAAQGTAGEPPCTTEVVDHDGGEVTFWRSPGSRRLFPPF
jgi:hypothetical protein